MREKRRRGTTRKILNNDGQILSLKCKYFVIKLVRDKIRDRFDYVVNFFVSKLPETNFIFCLRLET
jgi:hypothetical protein